MNGTKWFVMASVAALMLTVGCSTPCCKPVTSVPKAAQQTIHQYTEGGNIHELVMLDKHGLMFYKAEVIKADGTKILITVSADGKLYKLDRKDCKHE